MCQQRGFQECRPNDSSARARRQARRLGQKSRHPDRLGAAGTALLGSMERAPGDHDTWYNLGYLRFGAKQPERAIASYSTALGSFRAPAWFSVSSAAR